MTTSIFNSAKHVMAGVALERLAIFVETLPDALLAQLHTWQRRITERRRMAQMDERFLIDVGLDRADIDREVAKPFWRA